MMKIQGVNFFVTIFSTLREKFFYSVGQAGEGYLFQFKYLHILFALLALGGGCLLSTPAQAQTPSDIQNAERQSEQILRDQQLRQQDDLQRNLRNKRPPTIIDAPLPKTPTGTGEGCLDIHTITLTGADHMPARKITEMTGRYQGRCLGVAEIQALLSEITGYYILSGYATTRAYLPAQDLSTGTLQIDIIEGTVDSIRLNEADPGTLYIPNAFPGVAGEILNLRDIEQGLDQINRLASNNATMDIAPGDGIGESVIVIRNNPTKRWHANMTGDNYGALNTGRYQIGATLSLDNLLGLNEFYSVTQRKSLPLNDPKKQSSSTSALFSIPHGYFTYTLGYSGSNYDSTLTTPTGVSLHLDGDSRNVFGTIDYVAYRSQFSKLNLSATLTEKESRNFIADQLLDVSSRTLTVLDLSAYYSTQLLGGSGGLGLTYSRGLKIFGALDDAAGLASDLPHAQFEKIMLNASYVRPFTLAGQDLTWSSQLTAQAARDTLYGSEQISIGGIYTVRGFFEESLANDHGYYLRNDLSLRKSAGHIMGQHVMFRPYLALDAGAVTGRAPNTPHGTLVGAAAGLSLSFGPASFDVFTGHAVKAPDALDNEGFTTFGRLSVSF
jgi:hemolysin activation/secretion protein